MTKTAGMVNKVILVGHLGDDPEVKVTPSGQLVTNFSLATSESWTDKDGERQERPEWHRLVLWHTLAEVAGKYLNKGRKIYIEGKLQTRSWEDQNGQTRYTTEVVVYKLKMLGKGQTKNLDETPYTRSSEIPTEGGEGSRQLLSLATLKPFSVPVVDRVEEA